MHAMKLTAPGGLEQLHLAEIEPRAPGFGEIQVDIKATSLNFHDYAVVTGLIPADDGRIPMSDGAGVVTAVGDEVDRIEKAIVRVEPSIHYVDLETN